VKLHIGEGAGNVRVRRTGRSMFRRTYWGVNDNDLVEVS
jgi:hypothetical protein